MSIKPLDRTHHGSRVLAHCDDCAHTEYEPCDYERKSSGAWVPNDAQVIHRLTKRGWTHIKGKLRCLACSLARKENGGKIMTAIAQNVQPLREPTREQKRQIVEILNEVYDTKSERYRGGESDLTVADTIGGGCMFGWVATIREQLFGLDGRNEEAESLLADFKVWRATADKLSTDAHAALQRLDQGRDDVAAMQKRLESLLKAAGPRGMVLK